MKPKVCWRSIGRLKIFYIINEVDNGYIFLKDFQICNLIGKRMFTKLITILHKYLTHLRIVKQNIKKNIIVISFIFKCNIILIEMKYFAVWTTVFNAFEDAFRCKLGNCSFEKHKFACGMYTILTIGTKAKPLQPKCCLKN